MTSKKESKKRTGTHIVMCSLRMLQIQTAGREHSCGPVYTDHSN